MWSDGEELEDSVSYSTYEQPVCADAWVTNFWEDGVDRLDHVGPHFLQRSEYESTNGFQVVKAYREVDLQRFRFLEEVINYLQCSNHGCHVCYTYYICCDRERWKYAVLCYDCTINNATFQWDLCQHIPELWYIKVHTHSRRHIHCSNCGFVAHTESFCESTDEPFGTPCDVDDIEAHVYEITTNLLLAEAA